MLVLDCEGLVKWCRADQCVTALVREAQENDFRVVISALTPIEAQDVRAKPDRLRWYLSRLRIEPVTEEISLAAVDLLGGRHWGRAARAGGRPVDWGWLRCGD